MPSASIVLTSSLSIARPKVSAGSQSANRKWPGLLTRQCFKILASFICASQTVSSGASPPDFLQIGHQKSRYAVVDIGASAHNVDIAEFRPRLSREMAHDLTAEFVGALRRPDELHQV